MKKANIMKNTLISSLMIGALSMAAGTASAEVVDLCAGTTLKPLPDGTSVPMWGYALGGATVTAGVCDNPPTFPGPEIRVPEGDTALTINLTNTLPESTSIVVPGLPMPTPLGPTWDDGTTGPRANAAQRVRSFGAEAPADAGIGTTQFSWTNIRPGTFIYHSGTHPQKQVYMGLYGAMIQNFAGAGAGLAEAYDGVEYFNEVVLFYSEIDTDQNNAVAGGTHETSIHYQANWFLVNGAPYSTTCTDTVVSGVDDASGYDCADMAQTDDIDVGTGEVALQADQKTLIRFLSAAGETHVPTIQGMHMNIHAEDGFEYNWQDGATEMANAPRQQYSVMMPPLKTKDVIVSAPADGRYAIYDGNGYMTNPTNPALPEYTDPVGGMLRFLSFAPASTVDLEPIADPNGPYSGLTGVPVAFDGTSSTDDGTIVSYDWDFGDSSDPTPGTGPTPSHTYLTASAPGTPYTVTLTVTDDGGNTSTNTDNTADVTIVTNQAPIADPNGPYLGSPGIPVAFDGTGSSDPDGMIVSYEWDFDDSDGITLGGDATGPTPTWTYAADGAFNVTLTVTDNGGLTNTSAVTTATIAANQDPIADPNGPYTGVTGVGVAFDGTGSSDPDGTVVGYEWDFGDGDVDNVPVGDFPNLGPDGLPDTADDTAGDIDLNDNGVFEPNTGSGAMQINTYADAGLYTVTLTVTDDAGGTSAPVTTTADISAVNQAPVAVADGPPLPVSIFEQPVSFDGSGSTDDDDIVSYEWDFGDNSPITAENALVTPSHTYSLAGTYVATLTVTDNGMPPLTGTDTAVVYVVANQAPVAVDDTAALNTRSSNVFINLTGNDTDFEDGTIDPTTVPVITSLPSETDGTVVAVPGGIEYSVPNNGYKGTDTLTYTVMDSDGAVSNEATVTINVRKP